MKRKTYVFKSLLILLLSFSYHLSAQKVDTTILNNESYDILNFQLSNDKWTHFEVFESNIDIEDGHTVKQKVQLDTFQIRRTKIDSLATNYEFQLSKKTWRKTILGKDCLPEWWVTSELPSLHFKISEDGSTSTFLQCGKNVDLIKKGFESMLQCIRNSDDQDMLKYALEWIEQVEDCDFQKRLLLQDLGMIIGHLRSIVPSKDKPLIFSVNTDLDSLHSMEASYKISKSIDQNKNILFELAEYLDEDNSSISKQSMKQFYNIFKDQLSEEEQNRDSIRLNSMHDSDHTRILINSHNVFEQFERNIDSSILNMDLKPTASHYYYRIRKISI